MNKILEHTHNGQRWLFVPTPERSTGYKIEPDFDCNVITFDIQHGIGKKWFNIPSGNFKKGLALSDITEEQAREMVERYGGKIFDYDPNEYWVYEDYTLTGHPFDSTTLTTALESLRSLIRSKGGDDSMEYLILKSQ